MVITKLKSKVVSKTVSLVEHFISAGKSETVEVFSLVHILVLFGATALNCCRVSFGQNLTPLCHCHWQVSHHLRAAGAEVHGLYCRDPPGAGHGPVLAPRCPAKEDTRRQC